MEDNLKKKQKKNLFSIPLKFRGKCKTTSKKMKNGRRPKNKWEKNEDDIKKKLFLIPL